MVPLQAFPGATELAVLLLLLLTLAVPIAGAIFLLRRFGGPDEERIEELEQRVEELESRHEE